MLKPKPIDVTSELLKLDDLMATLRKETQNADSDPFDDALVAAVNGAADAMKTEGAALEAARKRVVRSMKDSGSPRLHAER
ncbi:MAG: hypothetical protein ACRYGP_30570 [Janthinobacterium lividum]